MAARTDFTVYKAICFCKVSTELRKNRIMSLA